MLRKTFTVTLMLATTMSLAACGGDDQNDVAASCDKVDLPEDLGPSGNIGWNKKFMDERDEGKCLTASDARAYVDEYNSSQSEDSEEVSPSLGSEGSSASANSRSGVAEESASVDDEGIQQRKIFRDSRSFGYLDERGGVQPGAKYLIQHKDGTEGLCSFGWSVGPKDDASKMYNLTAGHCGEVGDKVFAYTDSGQSVHVGSFVMSAFDEVYGGEVGPGEDYALIEFNSNVNHAVGTPSVSMNGQPISLAGWAGSEWLEQSKPYMCRIGWRSGLSCGDYQKMESAMSVLFDNISDGGDSGGAVFAFDPADDNSIYAVAVNSYGRSEDATTAGGKIIEPVMNEYGLQIYN